MVLVRANHKGDGHQDGDCNESDYQYGCHWFQCMIQSPRTADRLALTECTRLCSSHTCHKRSAEPISRAGAAAREYLADQRRQPDGTAVVVVEPSPNEAWMKEVGGHPRAFESSRQLSSEEDICELGFGVASESHPCM
jgi:hypothetical protein